MISPVKSQNSLPESDSQSGGSRRAGNRSESQGSGINESALIFSQPSLDPLMAFLDIFEGGARFKDHHPLLISTDKTA